VREVIVAAFFALASGIWESHNQLLIKGVQSQIASQVLYWDRDLLKVSRNAMMLVDGLASDLFKLNV
jgi:hypothetical protein